MGAATTVVYLSATTMLLDLLADARGAVMALQTATFELGWSVGAAVTGSGLVLFGAYGPVHLLLGLLLGLSLGVLVLGSPRHLALTWRSARDGLRRAVTSS